MGARRRAIQVAAEAAGLGRVVRVHRQHRPSDNAGIAAVFGVFFAALATLYLRLAESPLWLLPGFLAALLICCVLLSMHLGPVRGGRRWFAAAEGGLLVFSPDEDALIVPYDGLVVRQRASGTRQATRTQPATRTASESRLIWPDGRGGERSLVLPATCCRTDLLAAARARRPVSAWTRGRAAGLAAQAVVAVVLVISAVPLARDAVLGPPVTYADISRTCTGGGGHGQAAGYSGAGPHPMLLYAEHSGGVGFIDYPEEGFPDAALADPPAKPDLNTAQLVACARLDGAAASLSGCSYTGDTRYDTVQGRYRVEVYEIRTGREVASATVTGSIDVDKGCTPVINVPQGQIGMNNVSATLPERAEVQRTFGDLVTGPSR
ncbi:MAG: hypothetical protein QOI21_5276 [Actinomycetota bacterium]|nr:hypothetical protein [Actinomycetota bacterium]